MRYIRKPENYTTAKGAAGMLREIADRIEQSDRMHGVYVTITSATVEEVEAGRERAKAKAAREAGGKP